MQMMGAILEQWHTTSKKNATGSDKLVREPAPGSEKNLIF